MPFASPVVKGPITLGALRDVRNYYKSGLSPFLGLGEQGVKSLYLFLSLINFTDQ
jgi:hypothetical protein